jgi:predicted porin
LLPGIARLSRQIKADKTGKKHKKLNHSRGVAMKKITTRTLLSLFVFSAVAPLIADAQTVVLYGRLNLDYERIQIRQNNPAGTAGNFDRVSSNSSRFGLRGSEDLGEGLSAIYQIESGFNADVGTGEIASRDSWVGINSRFGQIRLGKMDTPMKNSGGMTDRFKGTGIQDDGGIAALGGSSNGFSRRQNNSMRYDSPIFADMRIELQHGFETEDAVLKQKVTTLGLNGRVAMLKYYVVYEQHRNFVPGKRDNAARFALNYDVGPLNIGSEFTRLAYSLVAGSVTRNYFTVTAGYKVGNGTINARYGQALAAKGSAPDGTIVTGADSNAIFKGPRSGARNYTVGYEYNFSKRTQLFTYYTKIANEANANYRFGVNAVNSAGTGRGADPAGIVIGMAHDF